MNQKYFELLYKIIFYYSFFNLSTDIYILCNIVVVFAVVDTAYLIIYYILIGILTCSNYNTKKQFSSITLLFTTSSSFYIVSCIMSMVNNERLHETQYIVICIINIICKLIISIILFYTIYNKLDEETNVPPLVLNDNKDDIQ
jgi:hypothetical protein